MDRFIIDWTCGDVFAIEVGYCNKHAAYVVRLYTGKRNYRDISGALWDEITFAPFTASWATGVRRFEFNRDYIWLSRGWGFYRGGLIGAIRHIMSRRRKRSA